MPLVRCRISRTYQRIADGLQLLTVRDADGNEQTLKVTPEHPFFDKLRGWTKADSLIAGDWVFGVGEWLAVVANLHEPHPQGVTVYNLEVENAHTYFVRAEDATGEVVWVHNADYIKAQDRIKGYRRAKNG